MLLRLRSNFKINNAYNFSRIQINKGGKASGSNAPNKGVNSSRGKVPLISEWPIGNKHFSDDVDVRKVKGFADRDAEGRGKTGDSNRGIAGGMGASKTVDYSRPSGFRKGVREKTWENAKGADGKVRDPLTDKEMKYDEPWDMGHMPGQEFRKHRQSAQGRGITRKEFLDEHNNPDHYQPELPSSNRSHANENKTDQYFGP